LNDPTDSQGEDLARLTGRVRARARELGFTSVGITTPDPSEHMDVYRQWLTDGFGGEMTYLARGESLSRRADLRETMPDVRSVIVVGHDYSTEDPSEAPPEPDHGIIARYARGRDYHAVLKSRLGVLGRWLDAEVPGGVVFRRYVDTGPILERDLARRAGLGWFGRNTMLIDPRRGSYFFIGILLVDVELQPSEPFEPDRCGTCRACLDACPTGALLGRDAQGAPVMDARRCISYLTIEHRGPIPLELRPALGNRIYGCDICQEVCPWNARFAGEASEPGYAARGPGARPVGVEALPDEHRSTESHPGTRSPSLIDLMRMTPEGWDAFSRGSAIRRAGYAGFKRNVAVAMGNWLAELDAPPKRATAELQRALEDDEPLVREHAAWALGRIGSTAILRSISRE
jgi:epoxyqueuosine reductase